MPSIWAALTQTRQPPRRRTLSQDEQRYYLEWLAVAVLAISILTLFNVMHWGKAPGHIIYDQFHRWRAPLPANDIVIVGVDDASLEALGGWPIKRSVYANLLKKLADSDNSPKAIGLDILFLDRTPHDEELASQMRRHNIYLAVEQPRFNVLAATNILAPHAELAASAKGLAHVNVAFESDGFSRGVYLQEGALPHLSLAVSGVPAQNYQSNGAYRRFNVVDPEISFPVVALVDALSDGFPLEIFKDKHVLIGSIAPSLGDHFPTIYSGRDGAGTPGVLLHANVLNDILRGNLISPVPLTVQVALSLLALLSVLFAILVLGPLAELIVSCITLLSALMVSFVLLAADVWFDPGLCILAIGLVKPAWAWRRTEMTVRFISKWSAKLEGVERPRKNFLRGDLKLHHFSSDTLLQYSRLLSNAIGASKERLEFLNRIVRDIPTALLIADAEQRIVLVSPRMLKDMPSGPLQIGQPLTSLMAYLGLTAPDLTELTGQDHELSVLETDGTARHYILRVALLPQTGYESLWIFALTDISRIRHLESQRDQTLQLFTHDMRTPIAAIISLSRQSQAISSDTRTLSSPAEVNIQRNASILLSLMDDFIFSIKAREQRYLLTETLIDGVLDEAIYQVKDLAQSRQMRLTQVFDDEPLFVMADQRLLTRMLVNLLVNAVRYGQGDSDIHVALNLGAQTLPSTALQPGPTVQISIRNIVGTHQERTRAQNVTFQGFGLGMGFVKMVVHKHLGHIHFDLPKEPGAQAVVLLQLPIAKDVLQKPAA
jgi:CHASE2 domain-containing sensor protein/signal transduction histidine kinase